MKPCWLLNHIGAIDVLVYYGCLPLTMDAILAANFDGRRCRNTGLPAMASQRWDAIAGNPVFLQTSDLSNH